MTGSYLHCVTFSPSWFLDYQREIFEITSSRRWTDSLSKMLPRLIDLETLVVGCDPPETEAVMEQAAVCHMYGLFRATAMLARTAVES